MICHREIRRRDGRLTFHMVWLELEGDMLSIEDLESRASSISYRGAVSIQMIYNIPRGVGQRHNLVSEAGSYP
jgi:hypothetical protein